MTQTSDQDEITLLIPENTDTATTTIDPPSSASWPIIILQTGLAVWGFAAATLYYGAAQKCVASRACSGILVDVTGKKVAVIIYTGAGIDYGGMNAYQARSIKVYIAYLKKQKGLWNKIIKGGGIAVFAISQTGHVVLTALGTRTNDLQIPITWGGALPGSVYGAVNLLTRDLPYILSRVKQVTSWFHRGVRDIFFEVTEPEKLARARISHYRRQYEAFREQLEWRLKYVTANTNKFESVSQTNPIKALFEQSEQGIPSSSFFAKAVHVLGGIAGAGLAFNMTTPFAFNTFHELQKLIYNPIAIVSAFYLTSIALYNNTKFTIHGIHALFDSAVDVLRGKPIDSLIFQLKKKTTIIAIIIALGLSTFSYPVEHSLIEKEFPDQDKKITYLSDITMDWYHLAGIMHLFKLCYFLLSKSQKAKFLLVLEQEVERLLKMTFEDFIIFAEQNSVETNQLFHIKTFAEVNENAQSEKEKNLDHITASTDKITVSTDKTEIDANTISINTPAPQKKSYLNSWCCCFKHIFSGNKTPVKEIYKAPTAAMS